MSTLRTTTCAAAILIATLSLASCDRKAGDTSTASPGTTSGGTSGDASKAATPPASPASPASK
jgi:hypothetical protein